MQSSFLYKSSPVEFEGRHGGLEVLGVQSGSEGGDDKVALHLHRLILVNVPVAGLVLKSIYKFLSLFSSSFDLHAFFQRRIVTVRLPLRLE